MAKTNAKGRSLADRRHVRVYADMMSGAAWRDLSGNDIKVLLYVASFENGENNGELFMSERMAADGTGLTKKTAGKCLDALEAHGFIAATEKGYFQVKGGPATKWRLTWKACTAVYRPATHEYRKWVPSDEKSRAYILPPTGVEITPLAEADDATGVIITPATSQKRQKCVRPSGVKSTPHTTTTGEGLGEGCKRGRRTSLIVSGPCSLAQDRAA